MLTTYRRVKMGDRIDEIDRVLAERSFGDFVRQAWHVLEPRTPFLGNWHIDLLAEYLRQSHSVRLIDCS